MDTIFNFRLRRGERRMPKTNKAPKLTKKEQRQQQQPKPIPQELLDIIISLDEDGKRSLLSIYDDILTPTVQKFSSIQGEGTINDLLKKQALKIKKYHDVPVQEDEKLARVISATNKLTSLFKMIQPNDRAEIANIVNTTSQKGMPMESIKKVVYEFAVKRIDLFLKIALNGIFDEDNKELINSFSDYMFAVIEESYK